MRGYVLNLTPLLDLLLILVFAYQISTWVHASEVEQGAERRVTAISEEVGRLTGKLVSAQEELIKSIKKASENEKVADNLREALSASAASFEAVQSRLSSAVSLLLEVQRSGGVSADTAKKIAELVGNATEVERKIARELSRYEALGEVMTFVDVFVREDFLVSVTVGSSKPQEIVVDEGAKLSSAIEAALTSLESPRDVVIVMFHYGDILVRMRDEIELLLGELVKDRMPQAYPNRRIFLLKEGYYHE